MDDITEPKPDLIVLAVEVVSAFVANNSLPAGELPAFLGSVYAAVTKLGESNLQVPKAEAEPVKATTAQVRKSITPDALISFIDGKPYKTLKRHLGTHGLDIHAYRARFGLPSDYPSVSPNYSATRSALAKNLGLGRPGNSAVAHSEPAVKAAVEKTARRQARKAAV